MGGERRRVPCHVGPGRARWPAWLFILAIVVSASVALFVLPETETGSWLFRSGAAFLVLVALIVARDGDIKNPVLLELGNASYAIYLFHTIVLEWLRQKGLWVHPAVEPIPVIALMVAVAAGCVVFYHAVELPVLRFLGSLVRPKPEPLPTRIAL